MIYAIFACSFYKEFSIYMKKRNSVFHCKQFSLSDEHCAMKINTDAFILGAWTKPSFEKRIIDVGTGSGILALMIAQKIKAQIIALDIDKKSYLQAKKNFSNSPWSEQITAIHSSYNDYLYRSKESFDMIISNPPFFPQITSKCEQAPNIAKQMQSLTYKSLLENGIKLLSPGGKFSIILPYSLSKNCISFASKNNLYLTRLLSVFPTPKKAPNRCCMEFSNIPNKTEHDFIVIRNSCLQFSEGYKALTKDFMLNF